MPTSKWPRLGPKGLGPFNLVTLDEMGELKPPAWLVRPLFETNSVVLLFGPANEGKTFIALSLALAIAAGLDWCGHKVQQGTTVYVIGEGRRGIQKRAQAWRKYYDADVSQCRFIEQAIQVMNDADRKRLIELLRPLQPRLVVLDTLSTMTVGEDENDTAAMGTFMAACREISNELSATLLIVHHPTKADPTNYRGSYQLQGNVDTMILVRMEPGINATPDIKLACQKQKDEDRFQEFWVGTELVVLRPSEAHDDGITSLVVVECDGLDLEDPIGSRLSQNERLTLEAMLALDKSVLTTKEIIDAVTAKRGKDSASSVKNTWLKKLVAKGLVERVEEGVYRVLLAKGTVVDETSPPHREAA